LTTLSGKISERLPCIGIVACTTYTSMSLKVIPLLQFLHLCFYFSFYFYCYMYIWYEQTNKYLLAYIFTDFREIGLYIHYVLGLRANARGPRCASTGSKASGLGDKTLWSWRIFVKQIRNSRISKNKRHSLRNFSPTSELRIISRRHVDRRQVLSTVDRRPSPVDHTQRPALCTAWWRLGVTQRVARSVGVNQDL